MDGLLHIALCYGRLIFLVWLFPLGTVRQRKRMYMAFLSVLGMLDFFCLQFQSLHCRSGTPTETKCVSNAACPELSFCSLYFA